MINLAEENFLEAIRLSNELPKFRCKPSTNPCQAIQLFCETGTVPNVLLELSEKYADQLLIAKELVANYAASIDNWKVDGCSCPFGGVDHCNLLNFFLSLTTKNFYFFRGNDFSPEVICEMLQEWKDINLFPLITTSSQLATP